MPSYREVCGEVVSGEWKVSNGQGAEPLGLNNMVPFIEHLVNPCMMPSTFQTILGGTWYINFLKLL